ncbi:MAG TPA: hypothetical protein DEA90_10895 [Opitutae bacterium]|nr:hypothetical protein [Puniceicoccaceae bacterium]HBR94659.1 hypothetical protein [Opitutae bacterium]|tara:strand:+ start:32 stop:781 length:750 start_codon:yes stop_codon:yes gene_type:complete
MEASRQRMILYLHDIGPHEADDLGANANNKVDIETVASFIRKHSANNEILLTADDGYTSTINLLPLLEKENIPLIVFVTTGFVEGRVYPYEAEFCDALVAGLVKDVDFDSIHRQLRGASKKHRERVMNEMAKAGRYRRDTQRKRSFLSWAMLRKLNDHPLISIGSHTDAHLDLKRQSPLTIFSELRRSKKLLEEKIGGKITHISYPYGSSDRLVRTAARLCGYLYGYGTETGENGSRMNQRRISLKNKL